MIREKTNKQKMVDSQKKRSTQTIVHKQLNKQTK